MTNYFPLNINPQDHNLPEIDKAMIAKLERTLLSFQERMNKLRDKGQSGSFLDFLQQLADILQEVRFRDFIDIEGTGNSIGLDDQFELGEDYTEGTEIDLDYLLMEPTESEMQLEDSYTKAAYLRFPELLVIDLIALELEDFLLRFSSDIAIPESILGQLGDAVERLKNKRAAEAENILRNGNIVEFLSETIIDGVEIEREELLKNVDEASRENISREFDLRVARAKTYIMGMIAPWTDPKIGSMTNQNTEL